MAAFLLQVLNLPCDEVAAIVSNAIPNADSVRVIAQKAGVAAECPTCELELMQHCRAYRPEVPSRSVLKVYQPEGTGDTVIQQTSYGGCQKMMADIAEAVCAYLTQLITSLGYQVVPRTA